MICPNCNYNNEDRALYCSGCGILLSNIGPDDVPAVEYAPRRVYEEKPRQKKKNNKAVLYATIVILSILAVILIVLGIKTVTGFGETVTDAEGEKIRGGIGTTQISVLDIDGTVREIKTDKSLLTPEAILSEYTSVMNRLKDNAPAFTKIRYQNLPTDEQSFGALGRFVLPIIEKYVTSKTASKPVTYAAGNADKLPVCGSPYGCLLTDASKIKNAYCEILDDGSYKLVITLIDELNPEILSAGATSTQSWVSGIFDPYAAINEITSISELAFNTIDFNYTDCTVTLIYDKGTKEVTSINMVTDIKITAKTLLGDLNAEILDTTEYYDFYD